MDQASKIYLKINWRAEQKSGQCCKRSHCVLNYLLLDYFPNNLDKKRCNSLLIKDSYRNEKEITVC